RLRAHRVQFLHQPLERQIRMPEGAHVGLANLGEQIGERTAGIDPGALGGSSPFLGRGRPALAGAGAPRRRGPPRVGISLRRLAERCDQQSTLIIS
ncbi:hypothetical protein, partial [Nocardia cyriacigeorgica]|uniref:hypothetical protein n=1 Tax=Nocardia cyriacigeorgica TaxID=135487 RepID=UPI002457143E